MASRSGSVAGDPRKGGQSEPSFIVEYQGRFYVTVAVIEYDEAAAGLTEDQKIAARQIREMFEAGQASAVKAVPLHSDMEWAGQSTGPPPPP
ncbi:hypothetical protein [Sphingosinicella sp. CPCC 101087]|uniref:hypothetical protein n=1 Tax=Sphingosinicella sp. CPCC 101087 TaxID=2497754 RepID=UPI00101C132B|nr:hypothetical protein [Sphingosinicella sp. CPCC 101087]